MASSMGRSLKWNRIGYLLAVGGMAAVCIMVVGSVHWPQQFSPNKMGWWPGLFGFMFLMILGGVIVSRTDTRAALARRWLRITGRTLKEFPRTWDERVLCRPWAEREITDLAKIASYFFGKRETAWQKWYDLTGKSQPFFPHPTDGEMAGPWELTAFRAEHKKQCEKALKSVSDALRAFRRRGREASSNHSRYLQRWDLFKDIELLPVDPNGKTWEDPNKFRLWVDAQEKEKLAKDRERTKAEKESGKSLESPQGHCQMEE